MKQISVLLSLFTVFSIVFSVSSEAQSKLESGILVKARSLDGSTKEIRLYSGCHALVVGCSNYTKGWPMLPNAGKDAREVSEVLKEMGWEVTLLEDPKGSILRLV